MEQNFPDTLPQRGLRIARLLEDPKSTKLMAMGVLPGSKVDILRKAPFGKVYYVKVDGQRLALRQDELQNIIFE
ncbi:MAG: ferrous iron transport protein A [Saprospiraceae bacterium]|nr:ferrous iron transport protein A [Saprospiraceae bacterium]